jgi:hypothetical protein
MVQSTNGQSHNGLGSPGSLPEGAPAEALVRAVEPRKKVNPDR